MLFGVSAARVPLLLRGIAPFGIALGLIAAFSVEATTTGCGGCDWEGQCRSKENTSAGAQETGMCNTVRQTTTLPGIVTAGWSENHDRDPRPWEACECTVTNNTFTDCRYSRSDRCDKLATCETCSRNKWCGWCDGKCVLDTPAACRQKC